MKQFPGYLLWIAKGNEIENKNLEPNMYYVLASDKKEILGGPYKTERSANWEAEQIVYTGGT